MSAHLRSRIRKLEQAMGGSIPKDQQDPKLVGFLAVFGVPAEKVPYGIAIEAYLPVLAKAVQGNSIGPVKQPAS